MATVLLLFISNTFMTVAWYWHLKGGMNRPLLLVILISWSIALIEYSFAVPANRLGYARGWSAGQLKIGQEAIALLVFGAFMTWFLGEPLTWRHAAAFACIMARLLSCSSGVDEAWIGAGIDLRHPILVEMRCAPRED